MIITVTAEDIRNGLPKHCYACPISLAILRALPGSNQLVATEEIVTCHDSVNGYQQFSLPIEAIVFMQNFDAGRRVSPLRFELCPSWGAPND